MITIDELKFKLGGLETAVNDLRDALSIEASEKRLAELEHQMTLPGFYDDQEKSQKVISEMGEVKNKLERFGKLSTQYEEAQTLLEMIEEENDPSLAAEGEEAVNGVEKSIDELKVQLADYCKAVRDLEEALAIEATRKRVQELEHTMSRPGFYDDAELSKKVFDEVGDLKGKLTRFEKLQGLYDDAETMLEMLDEEYDPAMIPEAEESVNAVGKAVDELQLMTMLNGEYDHSNAILTFHAGTGGTEAQDWAEMLYRMYNKWAVAHGMAVEVLDYQDGDEAGLKSASMMVKGANAYGLLKSENGVHRLVRVSPFDANARRQTSFASLEVMPELDNTIQVNIRPEDIEMQVYRSSGAGGQHINKTSSAVRLIHKPTGIVVNCQTQRSQFQNRDYAMEMLKAKLYQIAKQQHMDKIDDIKGVQNEIAWGHQIRSYVFMPYTMVKDHRTNYETGNVDAVMDGDIDEFIFAYLKAASRGELQDA